ncbi:MAG: transglycosylase domain-containing protein [Syntrophomonadaceae bacterium]|jgi:1A family penicillin-binding protein|nr:PBP1A family penicillin-binding protein [Syntrophomonadaceae bacterium]
MFKKQLLIALLISLLIISGCAYEIDSIEVPEASVVFDIKGRPIKGLAEENRISIEFEEIPESFKAAIIAVEDKNFYNHHGIDFTGILRALFLNLKAGKITAGGSTITQQTAKTLYLSNERTISRKIKELFYALELERRYSKDEILTRYCNSIYFGHGAYGLEVAARTFFNKNARDLSVEESALLAGLPNAPSLYDPYVNPQAAKQRQRVVLQRMWEEGYITEAELEDIADRELQYQRADYVLGEAPYFIAMVRDYVSEKYGERVVYQGGLKIYTTLDLDMQKAANKAYQEGMKEREANVQAALVALDVSNGDIRALIGGRDFALSNYNRVFSERQPGSTFKPFLYSLAMEWGMTQAEQIKCEEVEFKLPTGDTYTPEDYGDDKYHWKEFTLKEALMISDNVIAVRLNHLLGPQDVANHAEKFGFKNIEPILSLPLGSKEVTPLDMAAAYSVFANEGIYSRPRYILKVMDRYGQVLEESDSQQRRVVSPENAYIISDMLKGVLEAGGTGSHLKALVGRPAAGKTGTTDDYNDAWFVGYTPQLCCAVWVGYDQGRNVNLVGGVGAGPIWANFMREASANLAPRDFKKPDAVNLINVCLDSGLVAAESCPRSKQMAFIEGSEPREICYYHTSSLDWLLDAVMP